MARQTPLFTCHQEAGARIVDFAGWEMPIQYEGIVAEHNNVREHVGVFDVSHMGRVEVFGTGALAAIQHWVTNDVAALDDRQSLYTPICRPDGGIVDDCLVYRLASEHFLIVVNASNRQKDYDWFCANIPSSAEGNVDVRHPDDGDKWALLAIQGPASRDVLAAMYEGDASVIHEAEKNRLVSGTLSGIADCMLACTGYTGEDGFEVFVPTAHAVAFWNALFEAGAAHNIKPVGLGARDTLRMEMRYPLYGQDIDDQSTPIEAGLGWTVKLNKGDFLGKDVLTAQKEGKPPRRLISFVMKERGVPRHGYTILDAEGQEEIGVVTSGGFSPSLKQPIGMGYVPARPQYAKIGSALQIAIRGKTIPIEVVKAPFYEPQS